MKEFFDDKGLQRRGHFATVWTSYADFCVTLRLQQRSCPAKHFWRKASHETLVSSVWKRFGIILITLRWSFQLPHKISIISRCVFLLKLRCVLTRAQVHLWCAFLLNLKHVLTLSMSTPDVLSNNILDGIQHWVQVHLVDVLIITRACFDIWCVFL